MFSRIMKARTTRALRIISGLALLAPLSASRLDAQGRDFLFKTPVVTLTVKAGYSMPRLAGGGDPESLWDFTRRHLRVRDRELRNRDFAGPHGTVEVGIRHSEHLDFVLAVGHSSTSVRSELQEWVGADGLPITQTTEFTTTPLTAGFKGYLMPRGRSIGSYAWAPRAFNAYAGVAGGLVWYRFEQYGDFVDFRDETIFTDNMRSVEKSPTVRFFAGMEVSINKRAVLSGEAGYRFAAAAMQRTPDGHSDFDGFSDLDLSGLKFSFGLGLRL